jgi:hypothetical protein
MNTNESKHSLDMDENIHSNKFNSVLGELPNKKLRWGITFIFVIFIILFSITMCLKLPHCGGESIFEHLLKGVCNI